MPNFTGASKNRDSKPQTTRAHATRTVRNGDVAGRAAGALMRGAGNRQFQNGSSRPKAGGR